MSESEKDFIIGDTNRNCWWRLLCVKKTSQKTFFVALVVLLLTIIGFLTVFGVLMIRQMTSMQQPVEVNKLPEPTSCRVKRAAAEDGDIDDFLSEKFGEVNKNYNFYDDNDEDDDFRRNLHKRSNYIRDSVQGLEKALDKSQNMLKNIINRPVDKETANLIEKDIRDVEDEINGLDDDIVSLLEISDLTDKSTHKRVRNKRDVSIHESYDLNPITTYSHYAPILEEKNREKRLIQQKLTEVRDEFIRCKKSTQNSDCEKIYHKIIDRFRQITDKFKEIEDIVMEMGGMEEVGGSKDDSSESKEDKKKKKDKKKSKNKKVKINSSEEFNKHFKGTTTTTTEIPDNVTTNTSHFDTSTKNFSAVTTARTDLETTTTTLSDSTETIPSLPDTTTKIQTTTQSTTSSKQQESSTLHQEISTKHSLVVQPEHLQDQESSTLSTKISNILQSQRHLGNEKEEKKYYSDSIKLSDSYQHHSIAEEINDNYRYSKKPYHPQPKSDHIIFERVNPILEALDKIVERIEDDLENPIDFSQPKTPKKESAESSEMVGVSRDTFTSLCENLAKGAKQAAPQQQFIPEHPNLVPLQLSSGFPVNFPTTGEMKGSSKVVMNPGFSGITPHPICFVQYPQYRQQPIIYQPYNQGVAYVPVGTFTTGSGGGFIMSSGRPGVGYQQPANLYRDSSNSPSYCAFLPNSDNNNLPAYYYEQTTSKPEAFAKKAFESSSNDRANSYNIPSQYDMIYATFPQIYGTNQSMHHHNCEKGKLPCFSTNQCISKSKWCDKKVDCIDASDETACSCKARLDENRICDGYIDCPMGDDELGCFGCDVFQHSCYSSIDEYTKNGESSFSMCYSSTEKCDGFINCKNGKDEEDCSMIVQYKGTITTSYLVSHSEGILNRNYKGKWYPVCKNAEKWSIEACNIELGTVDEKPQIQIKSGQILGQFIQPSDISNSDPILTDFCRLDENVAPNENHVIYVKCPQPKCGSSKAEEKNIRVVRQAEYDVDDLKETRIVGGVEALPSEFPFIVAIYKDGYFMCGGSIYNEHWILTAAHCTRVYENHYYEIRAGILRKRSHSPMAHISKVTHIIRHPDYERSTMKNDIALMRVKHHFNFNRWIRPICMPNKVRTGIDDWKFGPKAGTICSTLGWGAIRERGPNPDSLQVVEVPILSKCKYMNDREGESVCAGEKIGLKDACQGDSGGPLVCRSSNNPSEWYLTGIVSHGEGCARANEPGVYTRVALYIDWINEEINKPLPTLRPVQECPSINCVWGAQKCIPKAAKCNGVVDCLGAEDEINCPLNWFDALMLGSSKTENKTSINPIDVVTVHADDNKKITKKSLKELFHCTNISQFINMDQRCDRQIDCEDGTDEKNCTCSDHLKGTFARLICNGHVDCADSTDELDCTKCKDSEYLCAQSKTCIDKSKQCDGIPDCAFKEDELECVALTDGKTVFLDINGKPFMHRKGIITRNIKSHWQIMCDQEGDLRKNSLNISNEICNIIGFKNAKSFKLIDMTTSQIDVHKDLIGIEMMVKNKEDIDKNDMEGCLTLEIECSTTQSSSFAIHPIQQNKLMKNMTKDDFKPKIHFMSSDSKNFTFNVINKNVWEHLKDFHWPWNAEIFIEGEIATNGILLDKSWILVEKTSLGDALMTTKYTTAVLGNTLNHILSPYEQISRVDCMKKIENTNVMLLHLQNAIHYNRHVLPSYLPLQNDTQPDTRCLAVAISSQKITKSLELKIIPNCQNDVHLTCYQVASNKSSICSDSDTSHRTAAILCKKKDSSWYPKAFHRMNKGFCDFNQPVSVFPLIRNSGIYQQIQAIIDSPCDKCEAMTFSNETCETHRCSLGKCLSPRLLCNGINDCRNGSDENEEICKKAKMHKNCAVNEFQCKNGQCVDKSAFCNRHVDCGGDKSDEPLECTCFDFLRITDPSKICDGIINCWDKSDENAIFCGNKCEGKFRCEGSIFCVPHEVVCDQRQDCPNGADEKHCHGISETRDGFGEVLQRSLGLWHTKCFPKSSPPTEEDLVILCEELGFNNQKQPKAIVKGSVVDEIKDKFSNIQYIPVKFESTNATKVVLYSKFSPTIINEAFTVHLKTGKPLGKIVSWEKSDHENCLRMEIKCH